jgi:hypothetical protein
VKAKHRNRPVTACDTAYIELAVGNLQAARRYLRTAGAHNAANYVARALKSAQGAFNNAQRQLAKQAREADAASLAKQEREKGK